MRWGHVGAGRAALGSLPPPGDVLRSQKLSPGCGGACRTTRRGPEAPLGLMLWGRNQHPACWQPVFALPSVTVGGQHAPGFWGAPRTDAIPAAHHGTVQPRWFCSLRSRAWGFQVCRASSSIPRGCTHGGAAGRIWAVPFGKQHLLQGGRSQRASCSLGHGNQTSQPLQDPQNAQTTLHCPPCWCPVLLLICFLCSFQGGWR